MKSKEKIEITLNKIRDEINSRYGYYEGIPRINYGPCGVFAKIFYKKWNELFTFKVHICFVLTKARLECHHIVIRLPSGNLYDGGVGIHTEKLYETEFIIEDMLNYDEQILEKWAYGLDRIYPTYCPNFDRQEVDNIISSQLNCLFDMVGVDFT